MKKKICLSILLAFLLFSAACEEKTIDPEPLPVQAVEKPAQVVLKPIIPFGERRYIYNNGLKVEYKEMNTRDENNVKLYRYYPVISGLQDKTVQDKLNKELAEVGLSLISEIESNPFSAQGNEIERCSNKHTNTHIVYNYNNVMFVYYNANVEVQLKSKEYYPCYKYISYGYDLNTGQRIQMEDLFKPGIDFKTVINNYICQYIIDNNYDDFESDRMLKPFQGIREEQSFSFGLEGLRIILDDKNDEFVNYGYYEQIVIPMNLIGEDLYIFDRYFDEGNSIFENKKLTKKLLPNRLEFRPDQMIEEGSEGYFISITQGRFFNVPDEQLERKLNALAASRYDINGFKEKMKTLKDKNKYAHYNHYIALVTNAGGYLSMAVIDEIGLGENSETNRIPFNYDFNLNKEMLFEDLFIEGTKTEEVIKFFIKNSGYDMTDEMLDAGVKEAVQSQKFYFDEYGVVIYFAPEGAELDHHQKWIWIPYERFGMENIRIFN